jgi:hypothetical protein
MVCRTLTIGLTLAAGLAGSAHAQKTGSTLEATAVAKIEVQNPSVTGTCGKALEVNLVVKNVGAALSAKVMVNGVATAFALTKGETKTIAAKGGTFDCTKPPAVELRIPSPVAGVIAPLYQKSSKATGLNYLTVETQPAPNTAFALKLTTSACGSPLAFYAKYSAPASMSIPVTISAPDQKLTSSVTGGSNTTLTTTKNLDCAVAPPAIKYYTTTSTWLDIPLVSVRFN